MSVLSTFETKLEFQLQDEAAKLLSFQTLGTRMSQLDNIIKRRVSNQISSICLLSISILKTNIFLMLHLLRLATYLQADKVFFSMETDNGDKSVHGKMSEDLKRREKIVLELLKKVKKRRKMIRSYTYLSWFCVFFCCFLVAVLWS